VDIATIIGYVLSFGLIIGSIMMGGDIVAFIDVPSALIVVGGTIACAFIMESMGNVLGAVKVAKNTLTQKGANPAETIKTILELSNTARREGILALENQKVDDAFLAKGLRLAVDGLPREEIRETLTVELVSMKQRHVRGQKLFKFLKDTAPSMGMIGTLVGLVNMLANLEDPASIGPAMAVALLTTLYGAVMAFVVCGPIAEKLERRTADETANMTVVIEGVDAIVKGHNAAVIKDRLQARLAPNARPQDQEAA